MTDFDPVADLHDICAHALEAARYRPLTDDEINALRAAAGIEKGRPAASVNCGTQPDLT